MTLRPDPGGTSRSLHRDLRGQSRSRFVTSIEVLSPSNGAPAPRDGSSIANGRAIYSATSTSWKSTSSAAASVCPCSIPGPTVPTRCRSLGPSPPSPRLAGPLSSTDAPHTRAVRKTGCQYCYRSSAHDRWDLRQFRYTRSLDYPKPLSPSLDIAEAGWLKQQLQAKRTDR